MVIALVLGILMAKFMFDQYNTDVKLNTVFSSGTKIYLLEYGVYESVEAMNEKMNNFKYYIYSKDDDEKYHAYIGITQNKNNIEKLKGYFKDSNYNIDVKEININNAKFVSVLEQYDNLLISTEDSKIIEAIVSQVLSKYEELVFK